MSNNTEQNIPFEVLDLVRFMCATWAEIDDWACENVCLKCENILRYPVIQGIRNGINLRQIGKQEHDSKRVAKAVQWMLNQVTPKDTELSKVIEQDED